MQNDQDGQILGVLLFTRGTNLPGSPSLLFGYNAKERFSTWLRNTCSNSEDDIVSMGLAIADIGTHSFRKGVASSSLSNCLGLAPCGVEFGALLRFCAEHGIPRSTWIDWQKRRTELATTRRNAKRPTLGGQGAKAIFPFKYELLAFMKDVRREEHILTSMHMVTFMKRNHGEWLASYRTGKRDAYNPS
ncbi:hypothetical protein B5M09_013607 [Aphanomyces astaci]|uniref:Uncharacterized protein n=1 Tax=Aphanomyces astaci TaxID=112090 RepID=A0A425DPL1_APHAT|nr:hypothetical protein B5M09_013607 [Aphanomyces astaci]